MGDSPAGPPDESGPATLRTWRTVERRREFEHPLLTLETRRLRTTAGEERGALVLDVPDWVNVVPQLSDGRVVLIEQFRYGIEAPTLEIPGGMVDAGEAAEHAAGRELLEETGYRAGRLIQLGQVHPNPAIQNNLTTSWLATELEWLHEPKGDGDEEIRVVMEPLDRIPDLIRTGRISHSLVIAAFHFLSLMRP